MSQQNLEEEAGCGQADCRKMKKQAMANQTAVKETGNGQMTGLQKNCKNFLEILVLQTHTPHCGPLLLTHCTPVRPQVEAPREMTKHLLPVSPGPSVLTIPTATAPPNLPQQWLMWWCSIAQCIAHRMSTQEARWQQTNPPGLCLGLQTPHCCMCAGPHVRTSTLALPVVPAL